MIKNLLFAIFCAVSIQSIAQTKLMGFSATNAAKQSDWEKQFDAQLNPKNLDTWMQFITSHPHHVGSPQDKANAEYMRDLYTSWGWQSAIETYQVLFPTPKLRVLELLGAKIKIHNT